MWVVKHFLEENWVPVLKTIEYRGPIPYTRRTGAYTHLIDVIAVTPDLRVGPRGRVDVLLLLGKPGQFEHPVRVQNGISLHAAARGDATAAAGALAAGRTGPAGRGGHGRRAAAGRRARGQVAGTAGGQVPGPDVRLDGRERLLAREAARGLLEHGRRDAVYDVAQPAGLGRVRDGRDARLGDQVLRAHRPVVLVAAAAAARRPMQPAAARRAQRQAQALLLLLQVRDLAQREPAPVLRLHQQRGRRQRARAQAVTARRRAARARHLGRGGPRQVQRHRVSAAHLVHRLQHDGRQRAPAVRQPVGQLHFRRHIVPAGHSRRPVRRLRHVRQLLVVVLPLPQLLPLLLVLRQVVHHRVRQLGVQELVPQVEQRQHHELEEHCAPRTRLVTIINGATLYINNNNVVMYRCHQFINVALFANAERSFSMHRNQPLFLGEPPPPPDKRTQPTLTRLNKPTRTPTTLPKTVYYADRDADKFRKIGHREKPKMQLR